jgi:hypothetical protein
MTTFTLPLMCFPRARNTHFLFPHVRLSEACTLLLQIELIIRTV